MTGYMFRSKLGALIFMGFILLAAFRAVSILTVSNDISDTTNRIVSEDLPAAMNAPHEYTPPNPEAKELRNAGWGEEVLPPPR